MDRDLMRRNLKNLVSADALNQTQSVKSTKSRRKSRRADFAQAENQPAATLHQQEAG